MNKKIIAAALLVVFLACGCAGGGRQKLAKMCCDYKETGEVKNEEKTLWDNILWAGIGYLGGSLAGGIIGGIASVNSDDPVNSVGSFSSTGAAIGVIAGWIYSGGEKRKYTAADMDGICYGKYEDDGLPGLDELIGEEYEEDTDSVIAAALAGEAISGPPQKKNYNSSWMMPASADNKKVKDETIIQEAIHRTILDAVNKQNSEGELTAVAAGRNAVKQSVNEKPQPVVFDWKNTAGMATGMFAGGYGGGLIGAYTSDNIVSIFTGLMVGAAAGGVVGFFLPELGG